MNAGLPLYFITSVSGGVLIGAACGLFQKSLPTTIVCATIWWGCVTTIVLSLGIIG